MARCLICDVILMSKEIEFVNGELEPCGKCISAAHGDADETPEFKQITTLESLYSSVRKDTYDE